MPARAFTQVQGEEINLFIKKPGDSTFTLVGCAQDVSIKRSRGTVEYSCRSGKGKLPSGADPDWSFSLKGLYQIPLAADADANVSIADFFDLQTDATVFEAKVTTGTATGDLIFTGSVSISEWEQTAPQDGMATYSVEMPGSGLLVRTAVSA